jgi:hypothetical protein
MNITRRIGNFLITLGITFLLLFFLSDFVEQIRGWYLVLGLASLGLGVTIAWRNREEPEPTQKFRTMRRLMGRGDPSEDDEER